MATSAPVLPAEGILQAAVRWLDLLQRSSVDQAWALIRSDSKYLDLSTTQYAGALDWLIGVGLVEEGPDGARLTSEAAGLRVKDLRRHALALGLEAAAPLWLQDADALFLDEEDLPEDLYVAASALKLDQAEALRAVRQVHGHIDLARRAEVGAAGEQALIQALEHQWPGSTTHVALDHDGWGYDIGFAPPGGVYHLEVKATTRRGRLAINLSRQEYEIGLVDPDWRLVVVGLDSRKQLACIATVRREWLEPRAPKDVPGGSRWQSTRYGLDREELQAGLRFVKPPKELTAAGSLVLTGAGEVAEKFAWMPDSGSGPLTE